MFVVVFIVDICCVWLLFGFCCVCVKMMLLFLCCVGFVGG